MDQQSGSEGKGTFYIASEISREQIHGLFESHCESQRAVVGKDMETKGVQALRTGWWRDLVMARGKL